MSNTSDRAPVRILARPQTGSRKLITGQVPSSTITHPDQGMDEVIPIHITEDSVASPIKQRPQQHPTHIASLWNNPICCTTCRRPFKSYEKAWQYYLEAEPRCLLDAPIISVAGRGWFMVQIVVINPQPQYTLATHGGMLAPTAAMTMRNAVPCICEMCGLLTQFSFECGQCKTAACQVCSQTRMHRCALFCPYRACTGCSPVHTCPNIIA